MVDKVGIARVLWVEVIRIIGDAFLIGSPRYLDGDEVFVQWDDSLGSYDEFFGFPAASGAVYISIVEKGAN